MLSTDTETACDVILYYLQFSYSIRENQENNI